MADCHTIFAVVSATRFCTYLVLSYLYGLLSDLLNRPGLWPCLHWKKSGYSLA